MKLISGRMEWLSIHLFIGFSDDTSVSFYWSTTFFFLIYLMNFGGKIIILIHKTDYMYQLYIEYFARWWDLDSDDKIGHSLHA